MKTTNQTTNKKAIKTPKQTTKKKLIDNYQILALDIQSAFDHTLGFGWIQDSNMEHLYHKIMYSCKQAINRSQDPPVNIEKLLKERGK